MREGHRWITDDKPRATPAMSIDYCPACDHANYSPRDLDMNYCHRCGPVLTFGTDVSNLHGKAMQGTNTGPATGSSGRNHYLDAYEAYLDGVPR